MRTMRIRYYDEIADDYGVMLQGLSLLAFWGFWSRERIKLERKNNQYMSKEFGIYAIEGSELLGQAVMYEIPIETLEGCETIGGVAGVMSNPKYARAGAAKQLIERCHEIFADKGLRFSFLRTSRSLVAYNLYSKLGYETVTEHPIALKQVLRSRIAKGQKLKECTSPKEGEAMFELHQRYVKDLLGFIHRPPDFFSWRIRENIHPRKEDIVFVKNSANEILGYAVRNRKMDTMDVGEIVAPSEEDFNKLVNGLMNEHITQIVMWDILNPLTQNRLAKLGFKLFENTWGCTMALDLKGKLQRKEIMKLIGVPNRFNFLSGDGF